MMSTKPSSSITLPIHSGPFSFSIGGVLPPSVYEYSFGVGYGIRWDTMIVFSLSCLAGGGFANTTPLLLQRVANRITNCYVLLCASWPTQMSTPGSTYISDVPLSVTSAAYCLCLGFA